ncbi:concanavalin A-like lectin/glucanase [Hymenopellis radicata]|nr:concanavalin A-like lectin/glucanase [Hymenopellis radicata]
MIFRSFTLLLAASAIHALMIPRGYHRRDPGPGACQSSSTNFPAGSVADHDSPSPATKGARFVATSPKGSFTTATAPDGDVQTTEENGKKKNDKIGVGATVNMTTTVGFSKVSFEAEAPQVAGVVTALILIGDDSSDELDAEILGGDPSHFSTNMFAPPPGEAPIYGEFGKNLDFKKDDGQDLDAGGNSSTKHTYTIDWNEQRIQWSVDGVLKRTLQKDSDDAKSSNGTSYYPTHSLRVQMGIWDASENPDTAAWAKGPINWNDVTQDIRALVRRVTIDCGDG